MKKTTLQTFILVLIVTSLSFSQWVQTPNLTPSGNMNNITKAFISIHGKILVGGEATFGPFLCASTNNGDSWTTSFNGIGGAVQAITASGNRLLASTATAVFASTDTGKTWTSSSTGITASTGAYALVTTGNTVFAGTTKGTFMSTDNGQQWTQRDSEKWFSSLGVLGSTLFGSTGDLGKLFSSTDEGLTWNSVNIGVTDYNLSQIVVSGGNIYLADSWSGIRSSTDGGSVWTKITPDTISNISAIYVSGTNILAGNENGKIWISNNAGQIWQGISGDVGGNVIRGFVFSGNYALVAVRQNRVWRRPLSQITSVEIKDHATPENFALHQNFPNPFNPSTIISYQLPTNSFVTLTLYNVLGKEVATLVNEVKEAGSYSVQFSANSYQLSSSVYFYRLQAGNSIETRRMILIK